MARGPRPSFVIAGILVVFAGAWTALRSPDLVFEEPRLWAEEGRVYLSDALNHGALEALTSPHMGYYSLSANAAAAAAAHTVDLEQAPFITTAIALLLQLIPVFVIATSRAAVWATPGRKAIATLLLLSTAHGEVWLNTVNSQFFLAIAAALILVETRDAGAAVQRSWGRRTLLALAGLSGVVPAFLAPLWLWVAWRTQAREAWLRMGIVGACAALQLCVAVTSIGSGAERSDDRLHGVAPGTAGAVIITRLVIDPVAGATAANAVGDGLLDLQEDGVIYNGIGVVVCLLALTGVVLAAPRQSSGLLAAGAAITLVGSLVASWGAPEELVNSGANTRYIVFPVTCVLLFLADAALRANGVWRAIGAIVLIAAMARGAVLFRDGIPRNDRWPSWSAEVAHHRDDPTHRPAIWPGDPWYVIVNADRTHTPDVRILGISGSPDGAPTGRLRSTPARLGDLVSISILDAAPNARGWIALDDGVLAEPATIADLDGCATWLPRGMDGLRKLPFTCDDAGHFAYSLDLAIVGALAGRTYTIQARFEHPIAGVSNAVALTIGF